MLKTICLTLVGVVILSSCGSGGSDQPLPPPIQGQIHVYPSVLPEEGGEVLVAWSANELGVHLSNGLGLEADSSPLLTHWNPSQAGQVVNWGLRHATRNVTGSGTLRVRPGWLSPAPMLWQVDSPLRQMWTSDDGSIWLFGETRSALTGSYRGGTDIWSVQHEADGRGIVQHQWGGIADDQWRGVVGLHKRWWALVRSVNVESVEWKAWPLLVGPAQASDVACAHDLSDVLHTLSVDDSEDEWLLLGVSTSSATNGVPIGHVVLRHCKAWNQVLAEVAWPRTSHVDRGVMAQGSTADAVVLALTSKGDVGAGASGVLAVTLAQVDLRRSLRHRVMRVSMDMSASLTGGRISKSRDRVDWWGQRAATKRSPAGQPLAHAWILQTAGPSSGATLDVGRSWLSDVSQTSEGAWVWGAPAPASVHDSNSASNDSDDSFHILAVAYGPAEELPEEWTESGKNRLHWIHVQARGVAITQELPWLMHGLSGSVRISAAAQDASGDWLIVSEAQQEEQMRMQLDRFRADGRGRGRANLMHLKQTELND